jgi:hypothetical protein
MPDQVESTTNSDYFDFRMPPSPISSNPPAAQLYLTATHINDKLQAGKNK